MNDDKNKTSNPQESFDIKNVIYNQVINKSNQTSAEKINEKTNDNLQNVIYNQILLKGKSKDNLNTINQK